MIKAKVHDRAGCEDSDLAGLEEGEAELLFMAGVPGGNEVSQTYG